MFVPPMLVPATLPAPVQITTFPPAVFRDLPECRYAREIVLIRISLPEPVVSRPDLIFSWFPKIRIGPTILICG